MPPTSGGRRDRPRLAQASLPDVTRLSDEAESADRSPCPGPGGGKRALLGALPAAETARRRLTVDPRLGGRGREDVERRRRGSDPSPGGGRRRATGQAARQGVGAGRYDGPVPARRADRQPGDGRDARDPHDLVAPDASSTRASGRRSATRWRRGARRAIVMCHLSHVYPDGASLYYTFAAKQRPGWSSSSGGRSSRPRPMRSSPPAGRSPTTTRSAATTRPTWRPRWGPRLEALRATRCARPGRDHEPGQAVRPARPRRPGPRPRTSPIAAAPGLPSPAWSPRLRRQP